MQIDLLTNYFNSVKLNIVRLIEHVKKNMPRKRHIELREATFADIKAAARKLMAEKGTAGLSMRAIARELEMTAPALYYYYASLDDLITDLIVENFNHQADAMEAAWNTTTGTEKDRLLALFVAYRQWVIDNPVDFMLVNGNPIPGYEAPAEITVPAAARAFEVTLKAIAAALAAGEIDMPAEAQNMPDKVRDDLTAMRDERHYDAPVEAIYLTLIGWFQANGQLALEIYHSLDTIVGNSAAELYLYRARMTFGIETD